MIHLSGWILLMSLVGSSLLILGLLISSSVRQRIARPIRRSYAFIQTSRSKLSQKSAPFVSNLPSVKLLDGLKRPWRWKRVIAFVTTASTVVVIGQITSTQLAQGAGTLATLKGYSIPKPDVSNYVRDETALVQLGKAFFWDQDISSDDKVSCATCHFHAGADNRSINQINPGLTKVLMTNGGFVPNPDVNFTAGFGPNVQLKVSDFPVSTPNQGKPNGNDIVGSQGEKLANFNQSTGRTDPIPDPVFHIGADNVRAVTGRNSPSVINAVFNFRNFWDGRAQNVFNGANPFGPRDPNALVLKSDGNGSLSAVKIAIANASLASQAVGPPLSDVEMSGRGRSFADISKDLRRAKGLRAKQKLSGRPLANQMVARDDSVLGSLRHPNAKGLNTTYRAMIQQAFKPNWWNGSQLVKTDSAGNLIFISKPANLAAADEFTQMEYNFPLFFGLAVAAYETTLISDDTPVDRYLAGDRNALTAQEIRGMDIFSNKGKCISCHKGAELTNASVSFVKNEPIERMRMGAGNIAVYDQGFYNIGVRPTSDDIGLGGKDPLGNPLSITKLAQQRLAQGQSLNILGNVNPNKITNVQSEDASLTGPLSPNEATAVNGAFKTPSLRNIALTAPYFHNGSQLTLRQVVDFYDRGGDFQNYPDKDADIERLGLTEAEKTDLVAFLEALTDDRVVKDKAPFDHPELDLPNGVKVNAQGKVTRENFLTLPAVGAQGWQGSPNFLNQPTFTTSRASTPNPVLGGGVTAKDANCPAGTKFVPVSGGYLCK